MKTLAIPEYAFPALPFGIGQKNTVSAGPDDGTLSCNASHFWTPKRHSSTQQAIDNILARVQMTVDPPAPRGQVENGVLGVAGANICGHGNEGLLETGMGQNGPYDSNKVLLPWNSWSWGPQFERIKPSSIVSVSLWSCHTGAGQQGANLLYDLAVLCGRAVQAGTGFLYCSSNGMWWENGTVQQVATPSNKPAPIAAPTPHAIMRTPKFQIGGKEFEATDAEQLEIGLQTFGRSAGPTRTARGQEAKDVAAHLFISEPMDMSNVLIGGMITATLKVTLGSHTLEFTVYNDRLAVEKETRTGYYTASVRSIWEIQG